MTTTLEASEEDIEGTTRPRIWGRRRRLPICNDMPEELATTTEASSEDDDTVESTTTTEASVKEGEEMTRLSERL